MSKIQVLKVTFNPKKHHRRSIRLPGYDYTSEGWYFVTICVKDRQCLFGKVENNKMVFNEYGLIVEMEWEKTAQLRKNVNLDEYIIMPNHIHGIIVINDNMEKTNVGAYCDTPLQSGFKSPSNTIGSIIRGFKSAVTKNINKIRNTCGRPIWQRNYWEHVIRDADDLNRIRAYICENPLKWNEDRYYS